jgi:predicted small secreted protein
MHDRRTDQSRADAIAWRALALVIITGASALLGACNTTEGAGRDIQSVGRGIEDAADDAKD